MSWKTGLVGVVLAASLASSFAFDQKKPEPGSRQRFSLSQKCQKHSLLDELPFYRSLQQYLQMTDQDRMIVHAPGDNMPIIVPNISMYNMPIIKPGPEWYSDDKFVIKPKPEWSLPQDWAFKEFYKNPKFSRGILLYQCEHK
jgi:hypothetical protein